jgi:hypothetical protein
MWAQLYLVGAIATAGHLMTFIGQRIVGLVQEVADEECVTPEIIERYRPIISLVTAMAAVLVVTLAGALWPIALLLELGASHQERS